MRKHSWVHLTLSRPRPISYRNQSIDLLCQSMDWFLYDIALGRERVNLNKTFMGKTYIVLICLCVTYLKNISSEDPKSWGYIFLWVNVDWTNGEQREKINLFFWIYLKDNLSRASRDINNPILLESLQTLHTFEAFLANLVVNVCIHAWQKFSDLCYVFEKCIFLSKSWK